MGIVVAGAHAIECVEHRSPIVTTPADTEMHRAVYLEHAVGLMTGPLMEPVDVLGHESEELTSSLQFVERLMARVRLGGRCRTAQPVLPGESTNLGAFEIRSEICRLLRLGVLGPQTIRSAKVRYARICGDAGPREHGDSRCRAQPSRRCGKWVRRLL